MRATDLQIGDWVNIYVFPNENPQEKDLFPAKISTIMTSLPNEDNGEHVECVFNTKEGTDYGIGCASRPVDTCLPILFTRLHADINGFEGDEDDVAFEYKDNECSIVIHFAFEDEYESSEEPFFSVEIEGATFNGSFVFSYVHELQHLLRLCEISKEIIV